MATVNIKPTDSSDELDIAQRIDSLAVHKARLQKAKQDKKIAQNVQDEDASEGGDDGVFVNEDPLQVEGRIDSIALAKQRMGRLPKDATSQSRFAKGGETARRSSLTGSISSLGRRIVRTLSQRRERSSSKKEEGGEGM